MKTKLHQPQGNTTNDPDSKPASRKRSKKASNSSADSESEKRPQVEGDSDQTTSEEQEKTISHKDKSRLVFSWLNPFR